MVMFDGICIGQEISACFKTNIRDDRLEKKMDLSPMCSNRKTLATLVTNVALQIKRFKNSINLNRPKKIIYEIWSTFIRNVLIG